MATKSLALRAIEGHHMSKFAGPSCMKMLLLQNKTEQAFDLQI